MWRLKGLSCGGEGKKNNGGNTTTVNAQTPDALGVSVHLPMAGTCSLLSPDLGALVSRPAAGLCAPLSLACLPVPSTAPSSFFVWERNLSVELSRLGEPSWCYAGRHQWESPATSLIHRRLWRHLKSPFTSPS